MSRRLLWLNGLAILAVTLHHAAGFSLQAMFDWTDRYRSVTVPNYEQLGSTPYYVLMTLRLLLSFAGPAFFFISGYFVGITAKGDQSRVNWSMVATRIKLLLVPFVLWTAIRYLLLRRLPQNLDEILTPYHWIPLLVQFYLLSPFLVAFAKRNWRLLLLLMATLGWALAGLSYMEEWGSAPAQQLIGRLPNWLVLVNFPFWFPLGIVAGLYLIQYKTTLTRYRWPLLFATVVMAILVLKEYQLVDRLSGPEWLGPGFGGLTKFPFSLAVILCFLAFEKGQLPFASEVSQLGTKSLGIYLGNIPSVYVAALLMYHLTPALLGYQLIYFAVLVLVGLGAPLLLMAGVRKSPVHHRYRLLFG